VASGSWLPLRARLSMPPATEGLAFVVKLREEQELFSEDGGLLDAPAGVHYSIGSTDAYLSSLTIVTM
jgi:hypothetical protein